MAVRIFLHSIGLVFNQLSGAFRISGLLYLVYFVLSFIALMVLVHPTPGREPSFPGLAFLAGVLGALFFLWIAVGWHRFVLIDELPNAPIPMFHGNRILAYVGRGLQTALIVMLVSIVPLALFTSLLFATKSEQIMLPFAIVISIITLVISYRLAPMLPGAAIGQSIGAGAAWTATSGAFGTIFGLAVISAIASLVIDLPVELLKLLPGGSFLVFGWLFITTWVKLMVGVSILTTIYGVFVEKRVLS